MQSTLAAEAPEDPVATSSNGSCWSSPSPVSPLSAGRRSSPTKPRRPFPTASSPPRAAVADVRRRHRGGQGRLPEGRPDGLRQPLRHGLVFRRGLHRRQSRPAGHADRRQHRAGADTASRLPRFARQNSRPRSRPRCRRCCRASISRQHEVVMPDALAAAITTLRGQIVAMAAAPRFRARAGPRPTASMPRRARQTADFLIYSSLTTVARRPGSDASWTQNWPFEPLVGNTPTTSTFHWTWISFCFTFFAFGAVLFIYQRYLDTIPTRRRWIRCWRRFAPLTPSQRRIWKYFLVVAAVLLLQILVGSIMAHYYSDRAELLRHPGRPLPAVQLPARRAYPVADRLDRPVVDRRRAVPRAGDQRRAKPRGRASWSICCSGSRSRSSPGRWSATISASWATSQQGWFWFGNQGLSYIQLGRAWQIGFFAGLAIWSLLVFRALWPTRDRLWAATRAVLDRAHQARAPALGLHRQHRAALRVRHDPAHRHREILHHHRFLALVGGPSLGRAVLRVLRRGDQRLSADGGGAGVAPARRARGLSRTDPDLPRRRARHRPSPLLGGRARHVGAARHDVLLHRGAAAGAADHRGDPAPPPDQGAWRVQIRARLHLHHRRRVLEFRRRRRVRRRHAQRAAGQLL